MKHGHNDEPPRIVVGVDGFESSKAALRWAFHQAKLTGAVVDARSASTACITSGVVRRAAWPGLHGGRPYGPGRRDRGGCIRPGLSCGRRGVLFHRYAIDAEGLITSARIVPPTSQNQASIEDDLRRFVAGRLDLDDQQLTWQCEQAIRNYDPCICCATHFLDLTVDHA